MLQTRPGTSLAGPTAIPPFSPPIRRRLARRSVESSRGADETRDAHRMRLETALMALFRDHRRDEDFEALYAWCLPVVERSILARIRSLPRSLEAGELTQDVFVNLYRYASSFRDERAASFRSWVAAIAANVVRRKLSQRTRVSFQDFPDTFLEPADRRAGPYLVAQTDEERNNLGQAWALLLHYYERAYRELSPRDQLALRLVEVDGLTYAEACLRLKVGMSNMKMIMFRARRRIRARIQAAMAQGEFASCRLAG